MLEDTDGTLTDPNPTLEFRHATTIRIRTCVIPSADGGEEIIIAPRSWRNDGRSKGRCPGVILSATRSCGSICRSKHIPYGIDIRVGKSKLFTHHLLVRKLRTRPVDDIAPTYLR